MVTSQNCHIWDKRSRREFFPLNVIFRCGSISCSHCVTHSLTNSLTKTFAKVGPAGHADHAGQTGQLSNADRIGHACYAGHANNAGHAVMKVI
jgi:hypothetical protein